MLAREYKNNMSWDQMITLSICLNIAEDCYISSIMLLKISLGIHFLRLVVIRWHRITIHIAVMVTVVFGIAFMFYSIFQCGYYTNASDFVTRRLTNHCASMGANLGMGYTHAIISILSDWIFIVLPVLILRDALMKSRDKLKIGALLVFASIGGVASIVRLAYLVPFLRFDWTTFFAESRGVIVWSTIETGVAIIAGSVITLRPLMHAYLGTPMTQVGASQNLSNSQTLVNDNASRYKRWSSKVASRHLSGQFVAEKNASPGSEDHSRSSQRSFEMVTRPHFSKNERYQELIVEEP